MDISRMIWGVSFVMLLPVLLITLIHGLSRSARQLPGTSWVGLAVGIGLALYGFASGDVQFFLAHLTQLPSQWVVALAEGFASLLTFGVLVTALAQSSRAIQESQELLRSSMRPILIVEDLVEANPAKDTAEQLDEIYAFNKKLKRYAGKPIPASEVLKVPDFGVVLTLRNIGPGPALNITHSNLRGLVWWFREGVRHRGGGWKPTAKNPRYSHFKPETQVNPSNIKSYIRDVSAPDISPLRLILANQEAEFVLYCESAQASDPTGKGVVYWPDPQETISFRISYTSALGHTEWTDVCLRRGALVWGHQGSVTRPSSTSLRDAVVGLARHVHLTSLMANRQPQTKGRVRPR